jgi:hypothetical protein
MTKETYRERALRQILALLARNTADVDSTLDLKFGREFFANLASWAGKGKDEIVQMICREIGIATATVLKEPLSQIVENRRLQVTLELVPKKGAPDSPAQSEGAAKSHASGSAKAKTKAKKQTQRNRQSS